MALRHLPLSICLGGGRTIPDVPGYVDLLLTRFESPTKLLANLAAEYLIEIIEVLELPCS